MVTPSERNVTQKESEKKQEFTCSYTRNVYSVNWSQWNGNKMLKEKCGGHARKTLKRFTKTRQTLHV